jgi:hypothetical protein
VRNIAISGRAVVVAELWVRRAGVQTQYPAPCYYPSILHSPYLTQCARPKPLLPFVERVDDVNQQILSIA